MGNWTTVTIKTTRPRVLMNALVKYLAEQTNPYCEASRDWEQSFDVRRGELVVTGNETFAAADLPSIVKNIFSQDFEICATAVKSAVEILET